LISFFVYKTKPNIVSHLTHTSNSKKFDFSFYYQNVNSLRTKTSEVYLNSSLLNFDIFCLSETGLCPPIKSSELFSQDFAVFRKDRYEKPINGVYKKGGGILIALKNSLNSSEIIFPNNIFIDIICVELKICSERSFFIICCYIPPSSNLKFYQNLVNAVDFISMKLRDEDEMIVCGDFNLTNLKWSSDEEESFFTPSSMHSQSEFTVVDGFKSNGLRQLSEIKNFQNKQLDLIFCSDWCNIQFNSIPSPLVNEDRFHPMISFSYRFDIVNNLPNEFNYKYNFSKANFDLLNNYFSSLDFNKLLSFSDLDSIVEEFYKMIFQGFELFVPKIRNRDIENKSPWINKELRKLKNRKNKAWKRYLVTNKQKDYIYFVNLFNRYKTLLDSNFNKYVNDLESNIKLFPKLFWKYVNLKRNSDQYPNEFIYNNISSNDPFVISNFFQNYFKSSYYENAFQIDENYFNYLEQHEELNFNFNNISADLVNKYLKNLKFDNFPGPDGVPSSVLIKCSDSLSKPIALLFNKSISLGFFPELWKFSYIIPTFKKGKKNLITNYRPIAKLSCLPKLFELIVYDKIYDFCEPLLIDNQHGFVKNKSTTTNLIEACSEYLNNIESGYQTDTIFTDLSKAFEVLPHSIILLKLKKLGFPSYFLKWVESYLCNRSYSVLFRNSISDKFFANSGVPQGSHLGPLLFILSINDVIKIIKYSKLLIFADDMKIFKKIVSFNDCVLLQFDLNSFYIWCLKNNLLLNIDKCGLVRFFHCKNPILYCYKFSDSIINYLKSIRDLGVIFDENLNFFEHFDFILNKASSMLGFLKRFSGNFKDPYTLKLLFMSLVRPHLEYASQVWNPFYNIHSTRIECIQKKFLRFCFRKFNWSDPWRLPSYTNRLKLIKLPSLQDRRIIADIKFISQINNGNIKSKFIKNKITTHLNINSRIRFPNPFTVDFHRRNYGANEPISRMLSLINKYKNTININDSKYLITKKMLIELAK